MLERLRLVVIREVERQGAPIAAANALHLTQSALGHTSGKSSSRSARRSGTGEGGGLRFMQGGQQRLKLENRMRVVPVKRGRKAIAKQISLGIRDADASIDYLAAVVALAREATWSAPRMLRRARPVAMRVRRRACRCVRRARPMRRTAGRSSST